MIKLKDIANHVGISVSAASMALRDHESISDETKRRVLDASRVLGYRRPQRRTTGNIAFILCDRQFNDREGHWGLQGVFEAARKNNLQPLLLTTSLEDLQHGIFPSLLMKEVDGVIISGRYDKTAHLRLKQLKIPVVVLGNYQLGSEPWAACEADISLGLRLAVERLAAHGHQRLALTMGDIMTPYRRQIRQSFLEAVEESELAEPTVIHEGGCLAELAARLLDFLKQRNPPTGLIMEGGLNALCTACAKLDMKIPADISVISLGEDKSPLCPEPVITECDSLEIGRGAVEKLIRMINNPGAPLTREFFPVTLTQGTSVGPVSRA